MSGVRVYLSFVQVDTSDGHGQYLNGAWGAVIVFSLSVSRQNPPALGVSCVLSLVRPDAGSLKRELRAPGQLPLADLCLCFFCFDVRFLSRRGIARGIQPRLELGIRKAHRGRPEVVCVVAIFGSLTGTRAPFPGSRKSETKGGMRLGHSPKSPRATRAPRRIAAIRT